MAVDIPKAVIVFSGKRKSGKDFISDKLQDLIGKDNCGIMRLSGPLKSQYAKEHNLDIARLLDASEYKETYRADMIKWGETQRQKDPFYFCKLATRGSESHKPVWIISDARRRTDINYFLQNYTNVLATIRVVADDNIRIARGWVKTQGIDDAESECGLDDYEAWTFTIKNNSKQDVVHSSLNDIVNYVQKKLNTS
ncbi:unnamed protein product [Owenia fusiformis]|uniref:Phosphomevalonate kinase n=1 Tax=Owenia fusiformis TaxID=6347 RepID=A0A8S4NQE2_OWEFU|nr:unnamed protein product [Owenia fusiformis]